MPLRALDWAVVLGLFALNVVIGLAYARRAGGSTSEFFLSGRNVPWWLAGTSMVATTFGADTPLAVTGMVARSGIAGSWLWWSPVASGILTVFFFAALWRCADVMTDVELIEIRYAGRSASGLRAFRALYLALPVNCMIIGWVNLAMAKILGLTLGIPKGQRWPRVSCSRRFTSRCPASISPSAIIDHAMEIGRAPSALVSGRQANERSLSLGEDTA
jgi:Na+/proline symporter